MDVSCPQCGYAQLDVDAQNSVVYCRQCGFAVRVDPATGEAVPISQGRSPAGPAGEGGGLEASHGGSNAVFGLDPTTFLLAGAVLVLLATLMWNLDILISAVLFAIVLYFYWTNR